MKRFLILLIILLTASPLICSAQELDEYIDAFDLSSFDMLDDDTKSLLDELGIDDFDYESISGISFERIVNYIIGIVTKNSQAPVKSGITVIAFMMFSSLFKSLGFSLNKSSTEDFFETITNLIICVFIVTRITDCIALCSSTIKLCADFTFAFFPAFCIIVSASGGTMTSFSVNTTLLILAQGLNIISSVLFIPITHCFLAVGICASLCRGLNLKGITASLKTVITTSISALSAIFVSVLSVKTSVASRADALGLRSVRFAINSVVPVIGGSISEGLLSIQSYSSLIKTSVGVVGIIAVCAIFLPAVVETVIWRAVLATAGIFSSLFSDGEVSGAIRVFSDTLMIINVVLILSMVTTIISIGILVAARTAV